MEIQAKNIQITTESQVSKVKIRKASANFVSELLREEFIRRKNKNASYSLRSFAQNLKIDQSLLSKILSGKKKVSAQFSTELLLKAGVAPELIQAGIEELGYKSVIDDEFRFLSNWIPFAILELAKVKEFQPERDWMAKRLGVHPEEVTDALVTLERMGYIEKIDNGILVKKPTNTWSNTKQTSLARKNLQKRYAEMSVEAIDKYSFDEREHGSLTVAISKSKLPIIKDMMKKFRQELGQVLQAEGELEEVYQITMAAFPISKIKSKS